MEAGILRELRPVRLHHSAAIVYLRTMEFEPPTLKPMVSWLD